MGLFDVNMPLLYGEGGEHAFVRLQLEILTKSGDESIFAWQRNSQEPTLDSIFSNYDQILAYSLDCFMFATKIRPFQPALPRAPYALTNKGLEIKTVLLEGNLPRSGKEYDRIYCLPLNCAREDEDLPLVIRLKRVGVGRYQRALYEGREDWAKWPTEHELGLRGWSVIGTIFVSESRQDTEGVSRTVEDEERLLSIQGAVSRGPSTNWQP